jgi:hypothetical protein
LLCPANEVHPPAPLQLALPEIIFFNVEENPNRKEIAMPKESEERQKKEQQQRERQKREEEERQQQHQKEGKQSKPRRN